MDDLESNYIMGKRPFFFFFYRGPGGSVSWVVGSNSSYKPITNTAWVRARLCRLQKGCTRLAATSDKVYQLLAHGRWFSPGTPASSTTKTGRHDIAEILLKVALNTKNQSINQQGVKCSKSLTMFMITERNFKQWWSIIPPISTKQTTPSSPRSN